MRPRQSSKVLLSCAVALGFALPAQAQLAAPNAAGVSFAHVHLNVADIEVHRKLWVEQFDGVVVNRGEREGIAVGNVMAIYKRGAMARDRVANETIRLPSERAGLMMVFRTFEKLSYALVLMTEIPLAVNDEVRTP